MIKPFLTSTHIAQITANYLNDNSLKSEIGGDAVQKSELVLCQYIDLISDFDVEYTYQSGSLDRDAYDAAQMRYETSYQQYEIAMLNWQAADEAAKRANKSGTVALRPNRPQKPNPDDFVRWGDYYTKTTTHKGNVRKVVKSDRLATIGKKSFDSYDESKHLIPDHVAEKAGYVFSKLDVELVKKTVQTIHKPLAISVVTDALKEYYHRDVSHCIVRDRSTYQGLIAPIWEVNFIDDSKTKKLYIDEINGIIVGEKIDESSIWAAIFAKHLTVMFLLCYSLMQTMGGFWAFISALILQWAGFYGLYLHNKTAQKPSSAIAKFLDFFYIRELANQADTKTQSQLWRYMIGLDDYEAFDTYQKERVNALTSQSNAKHFVNVPV